MVGLLLVPDTLRKARAPKAAATLRGNNATAGSHPPCPRCQQNRPPSRCHDDPGRAVTVGPAFCRDDAPGG